MKTVVTASLLAALSIAAAPLDSLAQERPIRLIVPFATGGPTDILARVIAPRLGERLKQTIIVENRVGATGSIGTEYVAHAAPDGETMLLGTSSIMAANPNLTKNLRYDPFRDFAPVSLIATIESVLVVNPSVPVHTVKELIAYAKANPNKLAYASSGIGSTYHLGAELFRSQTGIEWIHVPYKGAGPAAQDVIAGHVQVMFDNYASAYPNAKMGKVRALGIASLKRHPDWPDLPTIAESGVPGYETTIWIALFLPAKTPQAIVDHVHGALVATMKSPEVSTELAKLGMQPATNTPAELTAMMKSELAKWGKVVKEAGIQPE